ncbi:MAG: tRNA (guanosine(46)-N7)-methyltransferase TrmB [Pseudohongiellaceae bacterium]
MKDSNQTDKNRPLKSFVIRASRLTTSQKNALESLWDNYVIPFNNEPIDLEAMFAVPQPLVIEIGFGMGDSLLEMAKAEPSRNYIGIEVHRPGVGKLLHGIESSSLSNLKIISHDAVEVLKIGLAPESVDEVLIFFPDPWHKKRHNKRRLIQQGFVAMLKSRLKRGSKVHMATDWKPYAEHMMEVMTHAEGFKNSNGINNYWESPNRPETKFERRGLKLGHGVWDLLFERSD